MMVSVLKSSLLTLVVFLSLSFLTFGKSGSATPTPESKSTLVIYNSNDPDSKDLANYYASRRAIPSDQVIGLNCPLEEEISRDDFNRSIQSPLRKLFEKNQWWKSRDDFDNRFKISGSQIRFVALMRGIPLKIRTIIPPAEPDQPPPKRPSNDPVLGHDEASVDSELAALSDTRSDTFGASANPYYRRYARALDSETTAQLLLVCRLDAHDTATVRRMIDDSIYAETHGLFGWAYIDQRSIPDLAYKTGEKWLHNAAIQCWKRGIPVNLDIMPEIFPAGFPITSAALYYGWYAWFVSGAMQTPAPQFSRGAVAVHIHSFSASSLRNPDGNWAAPLLARGAAATLGNVYEPYLTLTPELDLFNERLIQGFNLAESAYMSLPVLSWQTVVVGDPLYRPFLVSQPGTWRDETSPDDKPWINLETVLRRNSQSPLTQTLYLERYAKETNTGLAYEALGMLQSFNSDPKPALVALETSGKLYGSSPEAFRTLISRIRILQSIGDKIAALKLIDTNARKPQPDDRKQLLSTLRNEIDPPPPPPSTAPPSKKSP